MARNDEFFRQLRERYSDGLKADTDRVEAQEDARFVAGDQWDERTRRYRTKKKRPTLVENRILPAVLQVCNDGRQNKPSILCTPLDGGTEETAEYYQGRIRQIEYECDADTAYDTVREQQVGCGRGFYRVLTDERPDGSQYLKIEAIPNQFSVIWDPFALRYDLDDADWWIVENVISKDAYERRFGKDTKASYFLGSGGENPAPGWLGTGADGKSVRVADYYFKDYDDLDDDGKPTVCIMATNGIETLGDETTWGGPTVPLVPQWALRLVVDGQTRNISLTREAKDSQKLINLYVSSIAEHVGRSPKSLYWVPEGSIAGRETEWEEINETARSVIQSKSMVNGQAVSPPVPLQAPQLPEELIVGYQNAIAAVRAVTSVYEQALGTAPASQSGIAVQSLQGESDVGNFHEMDNEARSRKRLGQILLEILPSLDGAEPDEKPVRDASGKVEIIRINQPYADAKRRKVVHHDLGVGTYQVAISSGPSFKSQREQENARVGEVIKAAPELLDVFGDIYFSTMDGPGSQELAERMKRYIAMKAPGLIDADQNDPAAAMQQTQAQLQQMSAMNQQLTAQVHQLAQIVEQKQAEQQMKFKIAALEAWTTIKAAEIKAKITVDIADADRETDRIAQMFDAAHDVGLSAMEQAHAKETAQAAADAAAAQAQQAQPSPQVQQ